MNKLNGTEKQIAWAEDIRRKFYAEKKNKDGVVLGVSDYQKLMNTIDSMVANGYATGNADQAKEMIDNVLNNMTEARQWIDSRHVLAQTYDGKDTMTSDDAQAIMAQIGNYAK